MGRVSGLRQAGGGEQKKSQAARESDVGVFGIDISKDVLKAVTGSPKSSVDLKNISGGDSVFSFGVEVNIDEISNRLNFRFTIDIIDY